MVQMVITNELKTESENEKRLQMFQYTKYLTVQNI